MSDSRRRWRDGCPCKLFEREFSDNLQLLAHPVWWHEEEKERLEILNDLLKEENHLFMKACEENSDYVSYENGKITEKSNS